MIAYVRKGVNSSKNVFSKNINKSKSQKKVFTIIIIIIIISQD